MKQISILNNRENITFSLNPFPHAIIKDALPDMLANQLTLEFPIESFDTSMNNKRNDSYRKKFRSNVFVGCKI